ncbi:energy-coupling factor ABC transporter ATP-binding protein [Aestuariirhabdus litorea]|uniref:ATP-binding cassette domain-containing protein n=1 Tax=Aestuariirhabdus litorea TaxID=2528527 RepID=A0A3P3VMZ6_9GAMM|nr:ABC transporter ATP-binding protein [Aestuariirhabdus litorea]RRJ83026.1 ATP-binding cassette domain-containing protein [Aestuariirhabdus litorea]RWW93184.1 ATP-binding cassette domain-containing protein [Endozoicomonadaceae bacterium GTF-13]
MTEPLIQLRELSFGFGERAVLERVDFSLSAGERVALVGDNGAGKTTLLQLMVGLHRPSGGEIIAFGRPRVRESDFREVRALAGLLFQDSDDQLFCPTVLEDVTFGPLNLGHNPQQAIAIARRTLETLGLAGLADRITHKLSGGEKRMVALAGVLAMEPRVLLMDEPTNGLDSKAQERLLEHLENLPLAMLFVSHDLGVVERLATRAVLMKERKLCEAVMHVHPHVHTHSHLHIHAEGQPGDHKHPSAPVPHDDHHGAGPA